jgi:hypothetical protein
MTSFGGPVVEIGPFFICLEKRSAPKRLKRLRLDAARRERHGDFQSF